MNEIATEIDTLIIRLGAAWKFDNEAEHARALTELADLSRRLRGGAQVLPLFRDRPRFSRPTFTPPGGGAAA